MKHTTLNKIIFMAGILAILAGCSKDPGPQGPQGTQGNGGPSLSGNLAGYVSLYDQYGSKLLIGGDSVLVTIASSSDSTYTDSTGKYQFNNLTTGVYDLTFSKAGYGGSKINSQQFTGGGTLYVRDEKLSQIANFNVIGMHDSLNTTDLLITDSVAAADAKLRSVVVYIGTTPAVSADPANFVNTVFKNIAANAVSAVIDIPLSDLTNLGFTSGQTVYFATYGIASNYSAASSYEDFTTGRNVFTAISAVADTSSILMP